MRRVGIVGATGRLKWKQNKPDSALWFLPDRGGFLYAASRLGAAGWLVS